jgi:transposase-like protein
MATCHDTVTYKKLPLHFMGESDPLYSMLQWLTERMMEVEAELKVGAAKGKHTIDRTTHFSGTRVRRFDTRLGTLYLFVPKVSQGGYIPFFVTEKKRSERALIQVVQEAFINGVSTRKMERLARFLVIEGLSAGQVSEMTKELDDQVARFRTRPLEREYPVIWVDTLYEKMRFDGRIVSTAVLVVAGVTLEGRREILACEPMMNESEEAYWILFNGLKQRGLEKVWLCVSDAHQGLKKAVRKAFWGCSWQRCKVHFMWNILAHVSQKEKGAFAERLKAVWLQPTKAAALQSTRMLIEEYGNRFPPATAILEEGLEDALQYLAFSFFDHRKTNSTNILERLNREILRRSGVVGIFPGMDSYI